MAESINRKRSAVVQRTSGRRHKLETPKILKLVLAGSGYEQWQWKDKNKHTEKHKTQFDSQNAHVRKKEGKNTYSIGGPMGVGGASDTGANSTVNNLGEAYKLASVFLTECAGFECTVLIKGHSRNAVTAGLLAQKLKTDFREANIEVVLFDPVPGPGQPEEYYKTSVQGVDQSTVVYALNAGKPLGDTGFTPQQINDAHRIILLDSDHFVDLNVGYIYNGETYKGSNLSSLPSGFYVAGKSEGGGQYNLKKCSNNEEVNDFVRAHSNTVTKPRETIISSLANTFDFRVPPPIRVASSSHATASSHSGKLVVKRIDPSFFDNWSDDEDEV